MSVVSFDVGEPVSCLLTLVSSCWALRRRWGSVTVEAPLMPHCSRKSENNIEGRIFTKKIDPDRLNC